MDLFKIIQELNEERKRIDRVIAAIEELGSNQPLLPSPRAEPPVKRKRGRPRKNPVPAPTS